MSNQIWVTNETSHLSKSIRNYFGDDVVNYDPSLDFFRTYSSLLTREKEISSFDPTLVKLVNQSETDILIHSPPMKVEQIINGPADAIRIFLEGAWRIGDIVKRSKIKLIHINLPVYSNISNKNTLLYFLNSSIKNIYDVLEIPYVVLNPPFLYSERPGNIIYSIANENDDQTFYIDSESEKPFMHVDDFLTVLDSTISNFTNLVGNEWDVPPSEVISFSDILDVCGVYHSFREDVDLYYFETTNDITYHSILRTQNSMKLFETIEKIRTGNE